MLATLIPWPLRSCVFELVSHVANRYAFFRSRRAEGWLLCIVLFQTFTNTLRTQQKYRDPGYISSSYCGPFCLSDYPKHKINWLSKLQPSYRSVLLFSLVPLVFLYFGLHFRIVTYLCRNLFPDTILYNAAVAKTALTSKLDLCCKPLSAQPACMANTRDAPTNLRSEVLMEQCTLCLFYFRWLPVYFIRYELYILSTVYYYARYEGSISISSNTTYVRTRYMNVRDEYISFVTPRPRISIYAPEVFWIFCCWTARYSIYGVYTPHLYACDGVPYWIECLRIYVYKKSLALR